MKKILWGSLTLLLLTVLITGWWYLRLRSAVLQWEGPAADILSEQLEKNADVMEIAFSTRIDAPVEQVFRAFTEPERSPEFSDSVRFAKLLEHEGNRKVVELEMVILGQPQHSTLEFTFLPEEHRIMVRTIENQFSDLTGEYRLTPSPDGTKTLLTYTGTAKDKAKLSIPLAMQKSALRETFVSTVRALKKSLAAQATPTSQTAL